MIPPKSLLKNHPHYDDCVRVFHQACTHWLTTKSDIPFGVVLTRQNRAKMLEYPKKNPKEPAIEWLVQQLSKPARARAFGLCYRAELRAKAKMDVFRVAVQHRRGGDVLVFYVPESDPQRWWVEEGTPFLQAPKTDRFMG